MTNPLQTWQLTISSCISICNRMQKFKKGAITEVSFLWRKLNVKCHIRDTAPMLLWCYWMCTNEVDHKNGISSGIEWDMLSLISGIPNFTKSTRQIRFTLCNHITGTIVAIIITACFLILITLLQYCIIGRV